MPLPEEYTGLVGVNDAIPLESDAFGNGHVTDTSSVHIISLTQLQMEQETRLRVTSQSLLHVSTPIIHT